MDFSFNEEQQMLLDATRRFITERYDFEFRNQVRASKDGWSRETWQQMAELGLLGLNIPEEDGGLGAGQVETMLVANVVGEGMLLEPFMASAVVATHLIAALGSAEQRKQWLPAMAAGEHIVVLAHDEDGSHDSGFCMQTCAARDGDGWRLTGRKAMVYHATAADLLLITARTVDDHIGLFAVERAAKGVQSLPCTSVDEQRVANIVLDGVHVGPDARLGADAGAALQSALDFGLAALCAEAFGAMDKLLTATIEYTRSRVQFGVPIGSFQALQHRMAEMLMYLEQARSMSYLATSQCTGTDPGARRAALSAAKVLMGQAARYIGQQAVQLHGGMGMTDELNVSHYFKRLLAFELRCGTTDQHLENYRQQLRVIQK
jgi:alkylation response protein AidB-like acyl-CoA dehydrogenase